jgi:uncharacterized membrane protein
MKALRRYIVAGILVWLPLGLTILSGRTTSSVFIFPGWE